jgi:hypothetical protein
VLVAGREERESLRLPRRHRRRLVGGEGQACRPMRWRGGAVVARSRAPHHAHVVLHTTS